jgi:hypothetical protein
MTECAVCGAAIPAREKLCSYCGYHAPGDELLGDPRLAGIQSELGRALKWLYFRGLGTFPPAHWPLANFGDAKYLISLFEIRDPEQMQREVLRALPGLDNPVQNAFGDQVLDPLTKIIGAPWEDARKYLEELEARGLARIRSRSAGRPLVGAEPLPSKFY